MAASSVPTAAPLPAAVETADSAASPENSAATPPPPPRLPVDTALIPGRTVEPIDLANALKLAGVDASWISRSPDSASSRPRPS